MVSKAQLKAYQKYADKVYDRLAVRIPKGERERFAQYATSRGISMAEYVRRACYRANPDFPRTCVTKDSWTIGILDNDMMVAESLRNGYNWKVVGLTANRMSEIAEASGAESLLEMMDQWNPIVKVSSSIRCVQDKQGGIWLISETDRYQMTRVINVDNVGWDGKDYFYFLNGVRNPPRRLAEFRADK